MEYTPKRFHCPACGFEPAENVSEKEYAHCPRCLTAIHEADSEGYECGGKLQPVSIWVKPDDSWEILGRCSLCGEIASTPVSDEDDPRFAAFHCRAAAFHAAVPTGKNRGAYPHDGRRGRQRRI